MQTNEFVKKYIKPYPFVEKHNRNVYAKVMTDVKQIEFIENTIYVNISLVNDNMLETDILFLNFEYLNNEISEIYKPYYYEYIAEISNNEQLGILKRIVQQSDNDWFNAKLIENYYKYNDEVLNGEVEFSASPFRERGMGLIYDKNKIDPITLKKLNSTYTYKTKTHNSIKSQVDNLLSINFESMDYTVTMYDVGQANCLYIYSKDKKQKILFDVGLPKLSKNASLDRKRRSVRKAEKALAHIHPTLVILSHWDIDHIKGAFLLNKKAFNQYWIAPDFRSLKKKPLVSMERLAKYLDCKDRLVFVPSSFDGQLVSNYNNAFLWKGDSKRGILSENNKSGLILELNEFENTIFAGDCEYESWPVQLQKDLKDNKNLVVPHHCSYMDVGYLRSSSHYSCERKAMISCGEDASKIGLNHPDNTHLNRLKTCGYVRVISKNVGKYNFSV